MTNSGLKGSHGMQAFWQAWERHWCDNEAVLMGIGGKVGDHGNRRKSTGGMMEIKEDKGNRQR